MKDWMDDERIIALFFARDEAALEAFAQKYRPLCRKLARDITGSEELAEECLNDLYLRLWNSIPPERPAALKSYACRIIRNLALHRRERMNAAKRHAVIVELDDCLAAAPEETGEVTALINEFLGTLSRRDAMIFVRRYFYTESVGEIAARLGMRDNQISKILHRLRRALREYLKRGGITV